MAINDLNRREEAARAMEGDTRQAKRAEEEARLAKRRQEATRAMESTEQRHLRESREELAKRSTATAQAKLDTANKQTAAERAKQEQTAAAQERARQVAMQTQEQKLGTIDRAGRIIETMKSGDPKLSALRTFKSDMARAVKEEGISIAKIAIAGQGQRRLEPRKSDHRRRFPWFGLVLILVLAGGAYAYYQYIYLARQSPIISQPGITAPAPLIFSEANTALDLTGISGRQAVQGQINNTADQVNFGQQAIKNIYFISGGRVLGLKAWLQATGLQAPNALTRNLNEEFMFGVYNNGNQNTRFLIVEPRLYELGYSAMLDWEKTLPDDILPLIAGTTLASEDRGQSFTDRLVHNKDARLLKNQAGETILFYAFLDPNHLVITRNEETFLGIFNRFTTGAN